MNFIGDTIGNNNSFRNTLEWRDTGRHLAARPLTPIQPMRRNRARRCADQRVGEGKH